ncbi:MAG: hypothetical protein ACJ71M_12385 [Nitrososphaeraceae archaeon]
MLKLQNLKGRLSNLRDEIQKQGFDIYSDEERGDFTFIEAKNCDEIEIKRNFCCQLWIILTILSHVYDAYDTQIDKRDFYRFVPIVSQ